MRGTNIADKRFLSLSNVQSNHLICRVVSDTGKKYCNSNSNTWWKKYCNTISVLFAILYYPVSPNKF